MKPETILVSNTCGDITALPLFQGVDVDHLHGLIDSSRLIQHSRGKVLLVKGRPVRRFYVLLSGWCCVSKFGREGRDPILQIFRRGDLLPEPDPSGDMATAPFNLLALTEVRVLALSLGAVRKTLEHSRPFMANMMAMSIRRANELREHICQLTMHGAEDRVGRFLLQMKFHTGIEGYDITLPFSKSIIAAYLGINQATFSHILQDFREKGFVIERRQVRLPNKRALCGYCNSVTRQWCNCPPHMAESRIEFSST